MKHTCVDCGAPFQQIGRGRPRVRCEKCSPPKRKRPVEPKAHDCPGCGASVRGARSFCGDACRYRHRDALKKLSCPLCGEPSWPRRDGSPCYCRPCWKLVKASSVEHGTQAMYLRRRCPCETCRAARRRATKWITAVDREAIYREAGWRCEICGLVMSDAYMADDPWSPTLDHIVPRVYGGGDERENLRAAHMYCNSLRGAPREEMAA